MKNNSIEQLASNNLIKRWRLARDVGRVAEIFNVLNEASNPAPRPKTSRVTIGTA